MLDALIAALPAVVTGLAFLLVLYSLLRRDASSRATSRATSRAAERRRRSEEQDGTRKRTG